MVFYHLFCFFLINKIKAAKWAFCKLLLSMTSFFQSQHCWFYKRNLTINSFCFQTNKKTNSEKLSSPLGPNARKKVQSNPRPSQGKMEKGKSWEEFSAPVRSWASKLFFCLGKVIINKFFFFFTAHTFLWCKQKTFSLPFF